MVKSELDAIPPLLEKFRQSVLAAAFRGDLTADWRRQNPDVEPASVLLDRIRAERRQRWEDAELAKMRAKGKEPKDDKWKEKYAVPEPLKNSSLPALPNGWHWAAAEELCSELITAGNTPKAGSMKSSSGEIPFIKVYNLTFDGTLDFSVNPTFIDSATHTQMMRSQLKPGDVLMNIVGPPLGKISIVPDDYPAWNMNQAIVRFRTCDGFLNRFLCFSLMTQFVERWIFTNSAATAGQFNIRTSSCRRIPVPVPPVEEQKVIVNKIDLAFERARAVSRTFDSAQDQLSTLSQSILAKAFRGELVPQDPNDEPASVLLERIRAERAASPPSKKRKPK